MADPEKLGKPWTDSELDEIVADYFVMLGSELSGRPYVKAQHSAALMAKIGRTHRSVEFKHQNISAVLEELGSPWIIGYKPKKNYQQAIFGAIDRHLSRHPGTLEFPVRAPVLPSDPPLEVFVDAPPPRPSEELPSGLRTLVRKFDPVERDHRNRSLGRAGEEFVIGIERRRLATVGRNELADRVRWVAVEDGDGLGYDVLSFDVNGRELLIEVKTTNGSARTPFFLTRNERAIAADRPSEWRIYRVHRFASGPQIFIVTPPLEDSLNLVPESWRAVF